MATFRLGFFVAFLVPLPVFITGVGVQVSVAGVGIVEGLVKEVEVASNVGDLLVGFSGLFIGLGGSHVGLEYGFDDVE